MYDACYDNPASTRSARKERTRRFLRIWNASEIPSNENRVQTMRIRTAAGLFKDPVWIDRVTGAI